MKPVIEKVALGTDGVNSPSFQEDGIAIPFGAITRMVFKLGDSVVVDSDITAGVIDWSVGDGVVECKFGALSIPEGDYKAKVIAYDALHPNGQMLAHESGPALIFKFVDG